MTDPARDLTVSPTTATVVEAVVNIDRVSAVEIERVRQQGDLKRLQMNLAAWESERQRDHALEKTERSFRQLGGCGVMVLVAIVVVVSFFMGRPEVGTHLLTLLMGAFLGSVPGIISATRQRPDAENDPSKPK